MFENIVKKIGINRIAHFGIGGTLGAALAMAFLHSIPMVDGILYLNWWNVQVPFLFAYLSVFFVELFYEWFIDPSPDKWKFIGCMLGVVSVHIASIIGWLLHFGNGHDLITTPWGWAIFGAVFAVLGFFWIRWVVKFYKK